jgi:lipoprotein-anchoring transpeptidase ErfK/SrfK
MTNQFTRIFAALSIIGALGATSARAQQPDTIPVPVDTTKKADSTRKADSTKAVRDSLKKPDSTTRTFTSGGEVEPEATKPKTDLRALGTVDGRVRLAADLSSRTLTVLAQNGAIRTFNIAIGAPNFPTPTGTYNIRKIVWNPSWIPPDSKWAKKYTPKGPGEKGNPMKVAKIFFREPDFYIHGTGEINSLGSAASHGCLRMHPDEIAELAQFLMQNGGQAREESWFSRVLHFRARTHTVTLTQPVTLTVSR